MTGDHRSDDHRPGPGCWLSSFVIAALLVACMGLIRLWVQK